MALQIFAWCQMAYNYSEDIPMIEALGTVINGNQSCDICDFANENNPIEDSDVFHFDFFGSIPLILLPSPITFKSFTSVIYLTPDTDSALIPILTCGVEPPPPKA